MGNSLSDSKDLLIPFFGNFSRSYSKLIHNQNSRTLDKPTLAKTTKPSPHPPNVKPKSSINLFHSKTLHTFDGMEYRYNPSFLTSSL